MKEEQQLLDYIDSNADFFRGISDQIWDHPEVRFDTPHSAKLLADTLREQGFDVEEGVYGLPHAFRATYGAGSPAVGFLAEYDALPGMSQQAGVPERLPLLEGAPGHACGHNAIGAGNLAGALAVRDYMQRNHLPGRLVVFGCPAEESGFGKAVMARQGAFDGLDALLTWHPMEDTTLWGGSCLSIALIYYTFQGVASHAAAAPEKGRSALDAAELMNLGVQFLREHIPSTARIHYAFLDVGGAAANVVQPTAKLHYFIRAPRREQVQALVERVNKVAQGAAMMTETQVDIQPDSAAADYVVNRALGTAMYENLKRVTPIPYTKEDYDQARPFFDGEDGDAKAALLTRLRRVYPHFSKEELDSLAASPLNHALAPLAFPAEAMMLSTDVGDASWFAPTAQVTVAYGPNGSAPHSWQWVAMGKSGAAHKAMLTAAKTIAMTAYDVLTDGELREKARKEHQENMRGRVY